MIETTPSVVVAVGTGVVLATVIGYWVLSRRHGRGRSRESTAESSSDGDADGSSSGLPFPERAETSEDRTIDPRILLPVDGDDDHVLRLVTVACALRHRYGNEPLTLLSTGSEGGSDEGERDRPSITDRIAERGIAAHTAIRTESVETGDLTAEIVRAPPELNTDLLVTKWDLGANEATGGETANEVVAKTPMPIYLFRLARQPSELTRLRLVIPQHVDHHGGFYEAVYNLKQLSARLELPVTVYVFERNVDHYRTLFDLVEIDVRAEFRSVGSWDELESTLETRADSADLLVTLAVREDEIGWDPELRAVANRFERVPPRSVGLCFLRADEPEYEDRFLRTS
ncbi:sodium/hydrogen exchanger [Natronococcus amylolyticus DSM 10524]|uniref:Sodium/hydrogen exchanger n=1 Tax=Natronococcus amylolyticus DSM 10524 TaxID=1227497 RepID=L9WWI8_9EURY|nr:universal stress protein [Natronococcus amylolyticus]ELY53787.1 sodium/hydrogen exchanger [Natronococcus amylolyticus DSM 10524]